MRFPEDSSLMGVRAVVRHSCTGVAAQLLCTTLVPERLCTPCTTLERNALGNTHHSYTGVPAHSTSCTAYKLERLRAPHRALAPGYSRISPLAPLSHAPRP